VVLLGDIGQVKAHFGLFGYSINLEAKIAAWFAPNVP
jgi:hypothetical protein